MIIIIAAWILLSIFIISLGFVTARIIHLKTENVFLTGMLGFFILIFFLQLYSLFLPININSSIVWLILFIASLFFGGYAYIKNNFYLLVMFSKQQPVISFVIFFSLLLFSYFTTYVPVWPDTYLYHFNSVKWLNEYGSVFGLANLHLRLGFNSALFLFGSFVNVGLFSGLGVFVANSFLLIFVYLFWINTLLNKKNFVEERIFCALTLPFFFIKGWGVEMVSYSTDLSLAIIFLLFIKTLISEQKGKIPFLVFFALLLLSIKLSGIIPLISVIILLGWLVIKKRITFDRKFVKVSVLSGLFLLSYIARNIVLSGWALFPMPYFSFPVWWKVPAESTKLIYEDITAWARFPGPEYRQSLSEGFYFWFMPWIKGFKATFEYTLLLLSMIGAGFYFFNGVIHAKTEKKFMWIVYAIVITIGSLLFWFIGAPDVRFGSIFFWTLYALIFTPVFVFFQRLYKTGLIITYVISALILIYTTNGPRFEMGINLFRLPPIFNNAVQNIDSSLGIELYRPVPPSDSCGDSPLPCTPAPSEKLRLKNNNDIKSGFFIEQ